MEYKSIDNGRANFNISPNNLIDVMDDETFTKSSRELFTIKFDGEPVESNEMDANELATSLLGISSVLEHANILVNGQNSRIFVKVRSSFKAGSFDVDIATFFTFAGINAAANIASLVGFTSKTVGTLIWLFKQTKGKKIVEKKVVQGNNYEIKVEGDNNSVTIIEGERVADILKLYENVQIRRDLADVIQPLKMPRMSHISFLKNGEECEKILKDETEYFSLLDTEPIDKKEDVDYFLITQSNFEGKQTGWRLSFGESKSSSDKPNDFPVKILDNDFLKKVKKHEIKITNEGTIIKARYRKTTQKLERLNVIWEILQVLKIDYTPNKRIDKIKRFFTIF